MNDDKFRKNPEKTNDSLCGKFLFGDEVRCSIGHIAYILIQFTKHNDNFTVYFAFSVCGRHPCVVLLKQ